jgi:hypothetical protein
MHSVCGLSALVKSRNKAIIGMLTPVARAQLGSAQGHAAGDRAHSAKPTTSARAGGFA